MKTVFLTSGIDFNYKDENGTRFSQPFSNINGIVDNFKTYIKKYDNLLYIASTENEFELTDMYAGLTFESFNKTLPFKKYEILDGRSKAFAKQLIEKADLILLAGGHVPTQNSFFNKIMLSKLLENYNGVILGISAGSMNSARLVYCPPELEGEALDPTFVRFFKGLGLVNFNIMPHYSDYLTEYVDGQHVIKDIVIPDSYKTNIYCISDGAYFLVDNNVVTMYGKVDVIKNGVTTEINKADQVKPLMFNTKIDVNKVN